MTKKIIAIFSSVLLLVGSVAPVFADSTITISGNGSDTNNQTNVTVTQSTQVSQTNSANITNNVTSSSNSGDNSASHNTGGNVSVDTGNAKTQVSVANTANSNVANVSDCNCGAGDVNVTVGANSDKSKNVVNTTLSNQVQVGQTNSGNVDNDVHAYSNSGWNDANHNTGGNVSVSTGNATSTVDLSTMANQNIAQVGSGTGSGNGTTASVLITGNGSDSYNKVNLGLTDWVTLGQTNSANVENNVFAKANTGENSTHGNTGGSVLGADVTIDTGNAVTDVTADTAVNFNSAAVGCDCLTGVTAKISGNGASEGWGWWNQTQSTINASLTNGQVIGQVNGGEGIDNNLTGKSSSGENHSGLNTGETADPSIMTGDSMSTTEVSNQGNANIFGSVSNPFPWNWNGSNTNVTLTFNLQQLLAALGL